MPLQEPKPLTLTRQQLYDEVWATPMSHLAKKFAVKSTLLVRVCAAHVIPRPKAGYWKSKRHGYVWPDDQKPLPPAPHPNLESVRLDREPEPGSEPPTRHATDDEVNRLIAEELAGPPIMVPRRLSDPHPLVAASIREDERREDNQRLNRSGASPVPAPTRPPPMFNVSASRDQIGRAYRIADALLKSLQARGCLVRGEGDTYNRATIFTMMGVTFDLRIYELTKQEPRATTSARPKGHRWLGAPRWSHIQERAPLGLLSIQLRSESAGLPYAQCKDGHRVRVEDRLKHIIIAALRKVDEERQRAAERERKAAIQREIERKRLEEQRLRDEAEAKRKRAEARIQALIDQARRWRQSHEVAAYVEAVRDSAVRRGVAAAPDSELGRWLTWATQVALDLDPLRHWGKSAPDKPESPSTAATHG